MFIRAYLRASTKDQDAGRAKQDLEAFVKERGLRIAATYSENESGAALHRPELFRLLTDCQPGDILLVEQVDRLSRLSTVDWERLKAEIGQRGVKVVALDLPTSWRMAEAHGDEFTARMAEAINAMLLDMLTAIARKDYDDRRRRQAQGIANNKRLASEKTGRPKYAGRPENEKRNAGIIKALKSGQSWSSIVAATGCSRSTLSRLAKRLVSTP